MCITFLFNALGSEAEDAAQLCNYKLILAANRDEWLDRPSSKAHFWAEEGKGDILGGKDSVAGGTWLGVCQQKICWVTNYRSCNDFERLRNYFWLGSTAAAGAAAAIAAASFGRRSGSGRRGAAALAVICGGAAATALFRRSKRRKLSRGKLVREFLEGEQSAAEYAAYAGKVGHEYGGFSLLIGDAEGVHYVTNRLEPATAALPAGLYAVSNALLDAPWGKLLRGKSLFSGVLTKQQLRKFETEDDLVAALMAVLSDTTQCVPPRTSWLPELPLPLLPALPAQIEKVLARVCVPLAPLPCEDPSRLYGTRASTVVLVDLQGRVRLIEKAVDPDTLLSATQSFEYTLL